MEAATSNPVDTEAGSGSAALAGESQPVTHDEPAAVGDGTVFHRDIAEWHGMQILDRFGERIGELEEIYVDVETDEPKFGTVKEGLFGRHLTFVPLSGITIGPDYLQVAASKEQVATAPTIALRGDELDQADEGALYHHFGENYTAPATPSGRRLARRS
jgi:hypothetical protein